MERQKVAEGYRTIMNHTDIESLEERVYESSRPGRNYLLKKGAYTIRLPKILPFWANPNKKPYVEIATKLDNILNRFYDLIGGQNIYLNQEISPTGTEIVSLSYINMEHYNFLQYNYSESFAKNLKAGMQTPPKMGLMKYTVNNEINIYLKGPLGNMTESLLGSKMKPTQDEVEFDSLIDNTIDAIDELFLEQGLEPTGNARHNLIGLVQNLPTYIIEKQEVQNLFGTDVKTHSINNPNLIRLAAKGVNDNMIRMFYVHDIYPDSIEEVEDLAHMPIEALYAIWGGKE